MNMKKLLLILAILLITPLLSISQEIDGIDNNKLNWDTIAKDVKHWGVLVDSIIEPSKKIIVITKNDIKKVGLLKHLKNNRRVYLPLIFLIILYIIWLKGRPKE